MHHNCFLERNRRNNVADVARNKEKAGREMRNRSERHDVDDLSYLLATLDCLWMAITPTVHRDRLVRVVARKAVAVHTCSLYGTWPKSRYI